MSQPDSLFAEVPGDEPSSGGGYGITEILSVTRAIEDARIACFLVGISALKYFGAARVRRDWEVCVPTERLEEVADLFDNKQAYERYPPGSPQGGSLRHTFPRFKLRGVAFWFMLIPSEDCHLECKPENVERSLNGLPYPRLASFAQSLLDTFDRVSITDLVDGMDLSEEWGDRHLNLDTVNDVAWAERKNVKIRASIPQTEFACLYDVCVKPFNLREIWVDIVRKKESRIGPEWPAGLFATRFQPKDGPDPRLLVRPDV